MLKRILLSVAPIAMIFGTVSANDDLLNSLAKLDGAGGAVVEASSEMASEDQLGQADVDALLGNDDTDEDAIAACFRRVGYGYGGYGHRHYSYGYSYYRPHYSYRCYRPVTYTYHYPVTYHVPVYTNWFCGAW
ncbi:hypothetical protein U8335_28340 [Roseiconus lacunae]|uniref:hypothetical protein n=1 Tax=Roseiconus lacunae TaxID=2605694 RepID=UPI003092E789|nr:hypothetical protein U8335_28340 [Stieleria sp. HD01]